MDFRGIQRTLKFNQINNGSIDEVFPLLCPVKEKEWLDGWDYKMIYSNSGVVEKNCVFTTPHHGDLETVWHVTQHDPKNHVVEFVRVTPGENVVRINIVLHKINERKTKAQISYQYTALNPTQNEFIEGELSNSFKESMIWWEKAINYYLETDNMLKKEQ